MSLAIEEKAKRIVEDFESERIGIEDALCRLREITGKEIDAYSLANYWRAESLSSFVRDLCMPPIEPWQDLSEEQSLALIKELLENITDVAIYNRNSLALEKRWAKPLGTLSDMIFYKNLTDPLKILKELKNNTVIQL